MPLCVCVYVQVPPALDIAGGSLTEAKTGKVAELHGLNWFGWETDTPGFDGLWVSVVLSGRLSWQRRQKRLRDFLPKGKPAWLAGLHKKNKKEEEEQP